MEWGSEIEVNGVRPEWLRDDEMVQDVDPGVATHGEARVPRGWFWQKMKAIRLPADHPYYTATEKGFTYWPGGDGHKGPSDYDGGEVLLRGGRVESAAPAAYSCDDGDYLTAFWRKDSCAEDIIGYTPRTEPTWQPDSATIAYVADKLREAGHADAAELILPTPVDPDVLAVREILAAHNAADEQPLHAAVIAKGGRDRHKAFVEALAAYRKHRP